MKAIAAAFVRAQKEFAPALKTSTNPHFKSKYAALDACIEAVIGALNNNGIALMQPTHECSDGVLVETVFLHESGEQISAGKLHVPATKKDAQGYGSALTYARRYSLMAACGIAPEDDDGNAASVPAPAPDMKAILRGIATAATEESLKGHFSAAWQMLDGANRDKAKAAYDKRKEELTQGAAA
ncbi:MAG: ERF family protein [Brachymonas sp.]|nr:ERF family protein [Brachymonas sp.]